VAGRTELPSGLVTFMFTDIEGSTRLARMLGEDYGSVLGTHRAVLRTALSSCGGVELFTEGDSFFVAFGEAPAAVAACVAAQRALAEHEWPSPAATPRVRMGLHTGWATPIGGEYASLEVHRAARVASAAHGGQILCSEATALAVTTWSPPVVAAEPTIGTAGIDLLDLGSYRLRGFDDADRLFQLVAPGLDRDFPRPRTPGAAAHNLPAAVTSFVGRRAEVAELTDLVTTHRLVTVAGAGGAGKTRLALEVAGDLLAAYPDGVWTIDCATAAPSLAETAAAALGLRAEPGRAIVDTLVDRCARRHMLVLLETVDAAPAEAGALVRRLLAGCRELTVLVTGRAPLGLHGELVWRLPPLAPADAFALLSERTTAARGGRPPEPAEVAELARVASRLDGLPLAIELAAARLRLLSPAQLVSRLDDPLAALDAGRPDTLTSAQAKGRHGRLSGAPIQGRASTTGGHDTLTVALAEGRHDTLTGTVDWSYRTLGERSAALLRRLAVFAGPVDLATVEWCGDDALGALSELADKSLVEVVPGPRYRMPQPIRGYAGRRLAAAGEERAARERHVAWSLHALDEVAVDTDGQPRTVSLTDLAPYVGEWQAALRWSAAQGSVHAGLRLAGALYPWWTEHGGAREGRDLLFRMYDRLDGEGVAPAGLASAYLVHAGLADDRDERTRFLHRAEAAARQADNPALLVRAMAGHRISLIDTRRFDEAERVCRDAIAQAERTGVPEAALPAVVAVAEMLWRRDALEEAAELLGGARQIEAGRPEDRGRRTVDWLLGMVALRRGDLVAAHDHLVVALRSRLRHGFRGAAADAVAAIAVRCAIGGDPATAARLFGGAESVRGARRTAIFGAFWSGQQSSLRIGLGDATFDAAYADGAVGGFDRIVATALAVEHPDLEYGSARFAPTLH
jgi:predicted ATPase/class 3 adenylate cyclase